MFSDMTDRLQKDQPLLASDQLPIDNLAIPMVKVNLAGHVIAWKRKMAQTTSLPANDDVNWPILQLFLEKNLIANPECDGCNDVSDLEHVMVNILSGKATSGRCQVQIMNNDEDYVPCYVKMQAISMQSINECVEGGLCVALDCQSSSSQDDDLTRLSPMHHHPNTTALNDDADPERSLKLGRDGGTMQNSIIFQSLNHIPVPAFSINKQGDILHWNDEMSELTGYVDSDVKGINIYTSTLFDFLKNSPEVHTLQEIFQYDHGKSDRASKRVECYLKPKFDAKNLHLCMKPSSPQKSFQEVTINDSVVIFVNDLTTNISDVPLGVECGSKNRIVPNDNELDSIVQRNANKFMLQTDNRFSITYCNVFTSLLLGFANHEIIGENIFKYLNLSVSQDYIDNHVLGTESVLSDIEINVITKSGEEKVLLVDISPQVLDDNSSAINPVSGVTIIGEDITKVAAYYRRSTKRSKEIEKFLDATDSLFFGVDMKCQINEWNSYLTECLGFSAEEVMGDHFVRKLIVPNHQTSVENVIETAYSGSCVTNFELEIESKWGQPRYLLATVAPRHCQNTGNVVGVIFLGQDVTESLEHDRAVSSMVCELRQLIDTANTPIFGIDADGDVNEWNLKTSELTGYSKDEAFDLNLVETFIVPCMQDSVQLAIDNALAGDGTTNFELEFQTKSRDNRHLLVNITTRRDFEGNVVGVVFVAQDVTESVHRDRAVAGMAAELRQLIDTANAPIFGIDIDGRVNEWNRCTQEITGYSKEETFDESLVDKYIAPSMRQRVQEVLDRALQGYETSNYELEFITKSGESRFLLVNATTRRDPDDNIVGVVGVAQDVTEDRKHEAELRKLHSLQAAQEAKVETERNMTAYFAHELRNPVSAIDSALSAMPDDLPESAKSIIHGMQLCTTFMSSIMNNLLDVRKMEEGKMTLKSAPTSLHALLSRVHDMLRPSVKPGVSFSIDCQTNGKDWVLTDEHRIQQVFTNVITNAMKYTVTGSIVLRIGWEGDMVKFECIDTGPGIPKSEQEKLFQRFVQRGGAPGTGLGLVIAKHLVDLTSGSIRFDSDPTIKAGTNCIVKMKLTACQSPDADAEVEISATMIEEPLRIFIIDDLKINRVMLNRRIRQRICPSSIITEAPTGEKALEICKEQEFDIIIVDQYMEGAGGVLVGTDVVYAMRRMKIDSIIIGCSGNDLREEFTQAGADWVWQKPMPSNEKIIAQFRQALEKKGISLHRIQR